MTYRFHPEALAEFEHATRYYEAHSKGLGYRFASSVLNAIDNIVAAPDQWPFLEAPIRRYLTRIFPYAILYAVMDDYILIVAVMHCHQRPGYWKGRHL